LSSKTELPPWNGWKGGVCKGRLSGKRWGIGGFSCHFGTVKSTNGVWVEGGRSRGLKWVSREGATVKTARETQEKFRKKRAQAAKDNELNAKMHCHRWRVGETKGMTTKPKELRGGGGESPISFPENATQRKRANKRGPDNRKEPRTDLPKKKKRKSTQRATARTRKKPAVGKSLPRGDRSQWIASLNEFGRNKSGPKGGVA